ncbi:MAG: translesion error-prone DNA polymerase V autoproteolytic subunit [Bacteroidia bacterium]|nr:translesion error-prone DNA polymerase V autoproteolytic subunit [Bacteroidia bacterium]
MKLKKINTTGKFDFYSADVSTSLEIPLTKNKISAGFPSPADDYIELKLDLNKELITNPNATFYARVRGNSMTDAGINDGDILVIDKSRTPKNNSIAVCFIDGEFTVKKIKLDKKVCYLISANPQYKPIKVTEENDFIIWGIVTYVIHKF